MKDRSSGNIKTPQKVWFTSHMIVVGIVYLMTIAQILFTHSMADGKFELPVDDLDG